MEIKRNTVVSKFIPYLLVICIASQLFDLYYVAIYLGALFLLLYFNLRKCRINVEMLLLIAFSVINYIAFSTYYYNGISFIGTRLLGAIICYLYGQQYIYGLFDLNFQKECVEKQVYKILFVMGIFASIFMVLCIIYKYTHFAQFLATTVSEYDSSRYVLNVWNGEAFHPTNFNSQILIPLAVAVCILILYNEKKMRIWSWFILVVVAISFFLTSSRSNLLYIGLSVVLCILFKFLFAGKKLTIKKSRIAKLLILVILVAAVICLFGPRIAESIQSTYLFERFNENSVENDGRWERMQTIIDLIPKYPHGNMPVSIYAHNIFLDQARESGVVSSVILLLYYLCTFSTLICFLRKSCVEWRIKITLLAVYVVTFLAFNLEPVLQGRINLYLEFCFVNGMVYALSRIRKSCFREEKMT